MGLHGADGENGKIQAAFDVLGIRYTGSGYFGSALAMDKGMAKKVFLNAGIPAPKGFSVTKDTARQALPAEIGYPCVVKPCCGGSSVGISIIHTPQEYEAALNEAFCLEDEVILEEYIKGREFSVAVILSKALPVIEIAPLEGFYDYKNKYKAGSTIETCPANLPSDIAEQIQHYAVAAAKALGLDTYCRVDFMLSEQGQIFCLEANTLPGMTPTSLLPQEARAIGIEFEDLCERLIQISLQNYQ